MKKILFTFAAFFSMAISATASEVVGAPTPWGYDLQLAKGELPEIFRQFHTELLILITVITLFVLALILYICIRFSAKRNKTPSNVTHNTKLEIIWTVVPILIVVVIMVRSLNVLYFVDKTEKADLTIKVTGYQWYWGYELPDHGVAEFESRIVPSKDLKPGQPKLLEVDEALVLPVGKTVKVLLTSAPTGVIHAWGIPALGFKRDTVPGRLSEGWLKIEQPGVYYGACYELCGPDHSQMPIKVIGVSQAEFDAWVVSKGGKTLEAIAAEKTALEEKVAADKLAAEKAKEAATTNTEVKN